MFKFCDLKQVHLEITNNCQASCPMCNRNVHGGLENPLIKKSEWTIEEFKSIITPEVLDQIENIYFCGNFGDPLLNNDLIKMCEYIKRHGNVSVRIHTNGSLRSSKWWESLAKSLPKQHVVIFGIDGLEDTHSRYRIGTDYSRIIKNAGSFIGAGGTAEWAFIVFEHNQHQVESARQTASKIGFDRFTVKHSSRFVADSNFPVYDKYGKTVDELKPSSETVIKFLDKKMIDQYQQIVKQTEIDCYVQTTKEVYIDAHKNLFPCCFLASIPYNYNDPSSIMFGVREKILEQYHDLLLDLGEVNTLTRSVKQIIDSTEYQTVWNKYWTSKKLITCARTCGKNNISKPVDQFVERIILSE